MQVRRAQEWLSLHRQATAIDGGFGKATERAVRAFQSAKGLPDTGKITRPTWDKLIEPMTKALQPLASGAGSLSAALRKVAQQHLAQHPLEIGGENRGPWVRLYMHGNEGPSWFWCAGFVTFLLRQACDAAAVSMPIPGSDSCDSLAFQAKQRDLFVPGKDLGSGRVGWSELGSVQIFLVRRSATDWTHCGLAHDGAGDTFKTVEGNTNDDGSRNGYEACARVRNLQGKDFIRLP